MNSGERTLGSAEANDLAAALRRRVRGDVRFDAGHRTMYAQDASHYRQVPVGVVAPRDTEQLIETIAVCREHGAPILMRGGGTSLAGQGCNAAVVLDTSRYLNRISDLDPDARTAHVQPGVVCDDLRDAAEEHGLTFGPDPSTHAWCTMGGMIGNNACGVHSVMAGKTVENVEALDVLTHDGTRMQLGPTSDEQLQQLIDAGGREGQTYHDLRALRDRYAHLIRQRYPKIPRRVSGYNLDELLPESGFHTARALVGSEGTCAVVLGATVRLVPSPPHRTLLVLGYPDVAAAGDAVGALLEHGPIGLEGMDRLMVDNMRAKGLEATGLDLLPAGNAWLMAEFGAWSRKEADGQARRLRDALPNGGNAPATAMLSDPAQANAVWTARASALGASARMADGVETKEGWEDAAVPPEKLGDYLRDFRKLLDKHGYRSVLYGHFGQGLVHTRINFDLAGREGIQRYRNFVEEGAELVVSYGGSISGEHGDGQARAELLDRMFGRELIEAFNRFKAIWDPDGKLNPHKLVAPNRLDANLEEGPDYRRPELRTRFAYPEDQRNFSRAVARCIGVGKCRRAGGGTMCPSYMATGEEKHSTRGRARLLRQMTEGRELLRDGWADDQVKSALDLCLSCKGCKAECPAGVDIATYKAEFLHHYHKHRRRPRQAYALGWVHRWARIASKTPRLANFFAEAPLVGPLGKRLAGIAPQRSAPKFAHQSFQRWCARGGVGDGSAEADARRPRVVLWPDTFTNYFQPEIGRSAVAVLREAGFEPVVPRGPVCCGRPLYDFGMLDLAERLLRRTLAQLRPWLRAGLPVVALEPSCGAVFRDELTNMLPDDPDAQRLARRTHTLAELLEREAPSYEPPRRSGRAIFHGHCHQKALMGTGPDRRLLEATGAAVEAPVTGCCGMAGSFGFHEDHYDVSMRIGERAVLPAARSAEEDTLLVTDGFSCREQIAQGADRRAHHLAEVLAG